MCTRKAVACAVLAGMLASAATPVAAKEVDFGTREAAADGAKAIVIGIGATTGVLALIGGAVWYYVYHSRGAVDDNPAVQPPPVPQN